MFDSFKTNEQGQQEIHLFKMRMTSAVEDVLMLMPEGRLRNMFVTKIEEAGFIGTKAISAKPGNHTHINKYTASGVKTEEVKNVAN